MSFVEEHDDQVFLDDDEDEDNSSNTPPPAATKLKKRPSSASSHPRKQAMTSIRVFRSFLQSQADGTLDASAITSVACYRAWLATRKQNTRNPEKAYQRALTGHITGVDGRSPFEALEEKAILETLRRKQRWPCFENSSTKFGELGFRTRGFHERTALGETIETYPQKRAKLLEEKIKKRTKKNTDRGGDSGGTDEVDSSSSSSSDQEPQQPLRRTGPRSSRVRRHELAREEKAMAEIAASTTTTSVEEIQTEEPSAPHPLIGKMGGRHEHVNYLVSTIFTMVQNFSNLGQWWSIVHGFVRMRLLTRGWFSAPSMENTQNVMLNVTQAHPDDYVILFDFTARSYADRIILQNDLSVDLFGGISREHGGFRGKRFLKEDSWRLFKVIAHSYTYPGHEFPIQMRWILAGGDGTRTAMFDVHYHVDETNQLLVERGKLASGLFSIVTAPVAELNAA